MKALSPKLTGLLNFLRQCLEDRKRYHNFANTHEGDKLIQRETFLKTVNVSGQRVMDATVFMNYFSDLRSFFFNAFPVISLSIYRMLEGTQWMELPFFAPFNEPYDLT